MSQAMGVAVSTTSTTSPFFLTSGIIGFVSFAFTLGTFIKVVWENFETATEAEHEVHTYLTNLRQELLEERASIRLLKKHCRHTRKERGSRHSREIDAWVDAELDQATLKTMSDAIKHLVKRFQQLEAPFLQPGEQGIQQAAHRRSKRRGEESTSPYYTHSAYNSPPYEKRPRSQSRERDDDDEFWPQRVEYSSFTWWKRMKWVQRKPMAQRLFNQLARLQTRRTARQVGGIAMVLHQYGGSLQDVDESINRIEDRLHRVVGVRRVE